MRVGSIDVVPVRDGRGALPSSMLFSASEEQWLPHRKFLDQNGMVPMEVGGFLLRGTSDRIVLVDLVVFTHLHVDHIGWAVTDEGPTFENATYRCSRPDFEYFIEPGGAPQVPLAKMMGAPIEADFLAPVADRFEVWDEGALVPGVTVTAAPGHTPGSAVIVISSGPERALLIGDVAHCPVEFLEPEWDVLSDVDPDLARRTREALAREYEGTDVPMAASHFEGMQFGRLLPASGKRAWVFA